MSRDQGEDEMPSAAEKPLHVQVAEALGCAVQIKAGRFVMRYRCGCQDGAHYRDCNDPDWREIMEYDTDWSATGPLIEKHCIGLTHLWPGDWGGDGFRWAAITAGEVRHGLPLIEGPTPLTAVCNLILALKESGKLENR
jgi:hypothetical protein